MLKLLSDLIMAERLDITDDDIASLSGYMGSWVTLDSNAHLTLTSAAAVPAYPIWNESAVLAETSRGFTQDVTETGKLTVLTGHHKALTNQYSGTPAIGERLATAATGVLETNATPGQGMVVAVCTKAPHSVEYRGTTFTCIEYETL